MHQLLHDKREQFKQTAQHVHELEEQYKIEKAYHVETIKNLELQQDQMDEVLFFLQDTFGFLNFFSAFQVCLK